MKAKKSVPLILLYTAIIVVAVFIAQRMWSYHNAMDRLQQAPLGNYIGPADSEKIIVEFLDYRCSYCRQMHSTMMDVHEKHPDVKIVYRFFPVFNKPSILEAQIALAAGMQGKFEAAHKRLITRQQPITPQETDVLIREIGLDVDQFKAQRKGPEIGNMLLFNLEAVETLGINSTPSFIVGDIMYRPGPDGDLPTTETFDKLLEQAYGP